MHKNWISNITVILAKFVLGAVSLMALALGPIYSIRLFCWAVNFPHPQDADVILEWGIGVFGLIVFSIIMFIGGYIGHFLYEKICKELF